MDNDTDPVSNSLEDVSSLEESDEQQKDPTASDLNNVETLDNSQQAPTANIPQKKEILGPKKIFKHPFGLIKKINIFGLIFILIILLVAMLAYANYRSNSNQNDSGIINQDLSEEDLAKLKNSNTTVGDSKQTLVIASNSIFNGRVLVKDNIDIAGTLKVGSPVSFSGVTSSGNSNFENVQVTGNLATVGNISSQGSLIIQKNLTVGGNGSFTGTITAAALNIDQLILNKDIQINRHIDAGGGTPGISRGSAMIGGGTVSINGTDTAGTINLNFGSSVASGTLANINFTNSFNQTPHIVITPVGAACANLNYYITRTPGGFTLGTTNNGPTGQSCSFDYIAID